MLDSKPNGGWDVTAAPQRDTKFGPDDYTALGRPRGVLGPDRHVARSTARPGAYVSTNSGRRYQLGQWPAGLERIPVRLTLRDTWTAVASAGALERPGAAPRWRAGAQARRSATSLLIEVVAAAAVRADRRSGPSTSAATAVVDPAAASSSRAPCIGSLYGLVGDGPDPRLPRQPDHQLRPGPARRRPRGGRRCCSSPSKGWPYLACCRSCSSARSLLGAGVEVVLIRRFAQAPRLILTVVTIGVGFLLLVLEFFTQAWDQRRPDRLADATIPDAVQRASASSSGSSRFTGDHLVAVVVVAVHRASRSARFFRFTDIGIAVRASAENGERASLLGIPVQPGVDGRVGARRACCRPSASSSGRRSSASRSRASSGPSILLLGLAAAVIARMESMPIALRRRACSSASSTESALFAHRPGRAGQRRRCSSSSSSPCSLQRRRAVPGAWTPACRRGRRSRSSGRPARAARHLPEVRAGSRVARADRRPLAAVGLPFIVGASTTPTAHRSIVIYAIVGVSLVILTGWAGQISLGQFAISGVGAAVAGGLAANHAGTSSSRSLVGRPGRRGRRRAHRPAALRIQGLFLAVTTLPSRSPCRTSSSTASYFGWLLPEGRRASSTARALGRSTSSTTASVGVTVRPTPSSTTCASCSWRWRCAWPGRCARTARAGSSSASATTAGSCRPSA